MCKLPVYPILLLKDPANFLQPLHLGTSFPTFLSLPQPVPIIHVDQPLLKPREKRSQPKRFVDVLLSLVCHVLL